MEKNVVLIGMPGVGKSTVGVVLAKVLNYGFLDSDLLIQEQEGKRLHEIIEEQGLEAFIAIENEVNCSIDVNRKVIATGGSVVYGKEAMEHLQGIGTVVYLKLSCQELANRLGNLEQRGVVLKPNQNLQNLYEERCPLYEKYAHVTIDCENLDIENLVEKIKRGLQMETL